MRKHHKSSQSQNNQQDQGMPTPVAGLAHQYQDLQQQEISQPATSNPLLSNEFQSAQQQVSSQSSQSSNSNSGGQNNSQSSQSSQSSSSQQVQQATQQQNALVSQLTEQQQMVQQQQLQMQQQQAMQQMQQMQQQNIPQQIRCSINNCHYWGQGNVCKATQILVTSNTLSQSLPNTMDAPMASQLGNTPVSQTIESCCNTFVQKGAFSATQDGVLKHQ